MQSAELIKSTFNIHVCFAGLSHSGVSYSWDSRDCSPPVSALSMGPSRQEYWGGLPCPPPGDLPNPGTMPGSPALQADCSLTELRGRCP